jgi:hypothetical protein
MDHVWTLMMGFMIGSTVTALLFVAADLRKR